MIDHCESKLILVRFCVIWGGLICMVGFCRLWYRFFEIACGVSCILQWFVIRWVFTGVILAMDWSRDISDPVGYHRPPRMPLTDSLFTAPPQFLDSICSNSIHPKDIVIERQSLTDQSAERGRKFMIFAFTFSSNTSQQYWSIDLVESEQG